ncbi:hypothetical protein BCR43DRAFT_493253 [Syncephalastrum racemosum]|uniref:Uncharacterized protein n=1 Tax=Syncephalastrum racemosum TaxID=13706 RepID=A0A1X2HAD3_SYNRA|nr:hypothetical protein BCR43DRAFT_493253 [Syncephalastrum racemosum]
MQHSIMAIFYAYDLILSTVVLFRFRFGSPLLRPCSPRNWSNGTAYRWGISVSMY